MTTKNPGKILIVDDEVELKNILVEALSAQGYETTGFTSGTAALAALRTETFDVLLTDLMMPEIDGLTLVRECLQIDPHLICMMMTGQGTIQTAVDAMKQGAFDYVLKPFRLQTMLPMITRAMNARHMRLENLQLRETVAIFELSQTIAFTLDPETVITKLADAALQQTAADEVTVLLPTSEGSEEMYVAAIRGEHRDLLLGQRVPLGGSIAGWVAQQHEPLMLHGEVNDHRFRSLWPHPEIRSAISIPMLVANKLVGIININALVRPRPFTLGQMKALTILAGTAAAALETASLYSQVQQAEENYRSIFENSMEGIFQATHQGRYLNVNPAMARILGYDSTTDLLASVSNISKQVFVNPEECAAALDTIHQTGSIKNLEIEAWRKDGSKIWLSMNLRATREGNRGEPYCEGTIEDITDGIRAAAALRESEERYRDLVENARDIIYSHDLQGRYTSSNRAGEEITGYTRAETLKLSIEDTVAPEFVEKARAMLSRKLTGEETTTYELELVAKDGRHVPVEVNSRLVLQDGVPVGATGIARDISERKQAEAGLALFRRLVDQSNDGIYVVAAENSQLLDVNETACRQLGYPREELLQLRVIDINLELTGVAAWEEHSRALLATGSRVQEFTAKRRDGSIFPMEISLSYVSLNRDYVLAVTRDITDRKAVDAKLKRLATAVDQTADSIVITDVAGNIEYVNPAFERITGYSRQEALGRNPRILKSDKNAPAVYEDLWETITRGEVWTGQLTNRKKNGAEFDERVTISAVHDELGQTVNYIAVKQDITRQVQLAEQLRQSQKLEAIGQLAGGVAHDFNNLLTVIGGYSSILLSKLPADSPHRAGVEEIKKAGDRAGALTRQLLAFSRKQILQPKILNLNTVVADLEKMVRRLIGEDIDVLSITAPTLGQVKADPGQIEQVLLNLIVNARDAMPRGGKLTIETRNAVLTDDYAQRHAAQAGSYVTLTVSDTGHGMDPLIQPRIFDPFFTTKGSGKGTGLGLATVYGIVKQSGGHIWVYSEVGSGSMFKIFLPRVDQAPESETEIANKEVPYGTELVLVVEDEDQVRAILKHILEEQGYQVLAASNGDEALLLARDHGRDIRLMITDVVMPQMSGRELAEHVLVSRPGLPVLFMSGYTDDAIVRHGLLDEKINFIQKPFDSATVARKVREVLDLEPMRVL